MYAQTFCLSGFIDIATCICFLLQVFDIALNGEHTVIHELDIYGKVGRGVAHDELVPFSIRNGKLKVSGETSEIVDGKVSVDFVKVSL